MATDYYLKIDGVDGEATDTKHKDWIEIYSFSWGCSQPGDFGSRGGGGGAGKVNMQDFSFTMRPNKATPILMQSCCSGKHYKKATLSVNRAGENQEEYLNIELHDVLVSSYQTGGSGGDYPTEAISLNFGKVVMKYTTQEDTGSGGSPIPGGWDVKANKVAAS